MLVILGQQRRGSHAVEFGSPFIQKPAWGLLAAHLAAMKQNAGAADAYRKALARTPGRTVAVEGLRSVTSGGK